MKKEFALSLKLFAEEVAERYSHTNRVNNYNNESV